MSVKTIPEPNKEVKVTRECDVVVVGGGPGGIGAAVAAARNGADTVLVERYGYLGGMGTGGLVTIIPCLSDFDGNMQIAGINQEWIDRLDKREACTYPPQEIWGFFKIIKLTDTFIEECSSGIKWFHGLCTIWQAFLLL